MNQQEQKDYYYNEQGFVVFTEQYLLNRGFCCGNGCKHCPYKKETDSTIQINQQTKQHTSN